VAGGYLELIRDQVKDPQAKRDANVALEELQRLARGADRMLMLAMGDHVDFIARAPVDLGQVVGSAAQRWRSTAQRNWVVRIQAPGMVLGDGDRITEALDALIENAVKATGPGDRISVELRAEDEFAVLEVADSGIGLAYEHLDHVFDRFWRASRQGAGRRGGAGLGLAIVRGIAEAHGGSAEAGHTAGGGATFRVRLPGVAWLLRPATVDWPGAVAPGLGPSGADNGLSA
jgi:two-component system sensor histidine kinase BaeS